MLGKKSYAGQTDKNAYGYGGISDVYAYLKDRYGGDISYVSGKTLSKVSNNKMDSYGAGGNNCSLVGITKMLDFYHQMGYSKINDDEQAIYSKVKAKAIKYGFNESKGLSFTKIANVMTDVIRDDCGYINSKGSSLYFWTYKSNIVKSINNDNPVMLNIATGCYSNHSITVCGYEYYDTIIKGKKTTTKASHLMMQVYDGWYDNYRYIDANAFSGTISSVSMFSMQKLGSSA